MSWDGVDPIGVRFGGRNATPLPFWDLYLEWVKEVGPPLVVACDIDLDSPSSGFVYRCRTHRLGFQTRQRSPSGAMSDRCPVSRLEEYRAKKWEATLVA